jgi:hypothetical protein
MVAKSYSLLHKRRIASHHVACRFPANAFARIEHSEIFGRNRPAGPDACSSGRSSAWTSNYGRALQLPLNDRAVNPALNFLAFKVEPTSAARYDEVMRT